jgi:hypothetical protein
MITRVLVSVVLATAPLTVLLVSSLASAQAPKFEFGKPEEVKVVEWKSQAKGGLMATTGNSHTTNGSVAANVSRKEGNNKLALDGGYAYGKSRIVTPVVDTTVMPNQITSLPTQSVETTNTWNAKARYDRFFTANNAAYASALTSGDKIAGKTFAGGGQVGYSRQVLKSDMHLLVAELGYDFSYERYVQQPMKTLDPVSIHSARVFVGETLKVSGETGLTGSLEALFNLNKEGGAVNVDTNAKGVDAFKDTLRKRLSLGVGFSLKYDQNPAPRPIPPNLPAGTVYAPTVHAFAETTDTLTELTLIYTFL